MKILTVLLLSTSLAHAAGSYPTQTTCDQYGNCNTSQVVQGSNTPPSNTLPLDVKPPTTCTGSQTIYRDVPATYYPQAAELTIPLVNVIGLPTTFINVKIRFDNAEHKLNVVGFE